MKRTEKCGRKLIFEHVLFMCIRSNGKCAGGLSSPHRVHYSELLTQKFSVFGEIRSWQDKQLKLFV